MSIQESIFQAIDVIAEKKINEIKFDKTVECIIIDDTKADSGEYSAKYQDIIIPVFSNSNTIKYKIDDNIYVLVPQGDFSNKKTIVGKKDNTGESFIDIVDIIDKVQKLGDNYVSEPEGSTFAFSPGTNQIKELSFRDLDFIKDYKNKLNLIIGANIETNLLNENGDFGIELDLSYVSGVRHKYRMSMNSMTGNPYRLEGQYQYKVFPLMLDEVVKVNGVFLYVNGFTNSTKDNYIKFTNVEVAYAKPKDVEGLEQFTSELFAPNGTVFKNGVLSPGDSLDLEMKLKKVGKLFRPSAVYKWFFMDSTVNTPDINNGWDADGGLGWRIIKTDENDYSGTLAIKEGGRILSVKADFVPNFETFKCIATFGGETIEFPDDTSQTFGIIKLESIETITDQTDAINIIIESSMGDVFKPSDNISTTELTCKVMFGSDTIDPNKFLYTWSRLGKDGSSSIIANLQPSEKLTVNVKDDIINIENFICEVYLKQ